MSNLPYLVALHSVDGLGPIRLKLVLEYFKDPKGAWEADPRQLKELHIPDGVIEKFKEKKKTLDPLEYFEKITKEGIKILSVFDEGYPKNLKEIHDPPVIIYYRGEIKDLEKRIGVVGTRKITGYGKTVTEKFTQGLVEAGLVIVSGLARGVDTVAHQAALESGGTTYGVLGGGLNKMFPPENTRLAAEIAEGRGAVLSEFPPEYPSLAGNFPSRNRIISGLSLGVLVTEAAEDSGSLITARVALDQGREVFAVPGPITSSLSKGPSILIKDGAKLVYEIEDILEELGLDGMSRGRDLGSVELTEVERAILEALQNETKHIDEICRELQKASPIISASLIKMEIMGIVKNLGGGSYIAVV